MGGNLPALDRVLAAHFAGAVGGIHILPFYPSSGDRGFAPLTYEEVDPQFGTWADVTELSREYQLTADFMINHISRRSSYFQDYLAHGPNSAYKELFIRFSDFWPQGRPTAEDLAVIYKRKPRDPYIEIETPEGRTEQIWCTFDEEQIDLNLASVTARSEIARWLTELVSRGPQILRLDAFAYTTKKPGTSCFFIEPDVWEILAFVQQTVKPYGVEILPEVHEHYSMQLKLAEHGYPVYDFALPMLLLHAIYTRETKPLANWFDLCPRKQFTTLDTHDGIGVVDVRDLLSPEQIEQTRKALFSNGANVKKRYNAPEYQNLDIYQINCTYYSALGDNDQRYLLARAVQFFWPGVPQIYYVGMLAGSNDIALAEQTRVGRNINRHNYSTAEIEQEARRPVVRALTALMRFRNSYPAFAGHVELQTPGEHRLHIRWQNGTAVATLLADFSRALFEITYRDIESSRNRQLTLP